MSNGGHLEVSGSQNVIAAGGDITINGDVILGGVVVKKGKYLDTNFDYLKDLPAIPDSIGFPNDPYLGLRWFTRAEARIFFGRAELIKKLFDSINNPHPASDKIIFIHGQSGVGKSSLLYAGLFPRLEAEWNVVYERRTGNDSILDKLNPHLAAISNRKTLFILDQLEEMLTHPSASMNDEPVQLLNLIQGVNENHLNVKWILSFRKEYLSEFEKIFENINRTKLYVPPLQQHHIVESIVGVSEVKALNDKYNIHFEEGLAEKIAFHIADDKDSHIAPALQILMTKLWKIATGKVGDNAGLKNILDLAKQRQLPIQQSSPQFTHQLYELVSSETGLLLDDFITDQLKILASEQSSWVSTGLVLDVLSHFISTVTAADEKNIQTLKQQYSHIPDFEVLLQRLQDLYLLTSNSNDEVNDLSHFNLRLAHDSLAPLLVQRYNSSQAEGQKARRILENRIKNSKDPQPLDKFDLKTVQAGKLGMRVLTLEETQLLELSVKKERRRKGLLYGFATFSGLALIAIISLIFLQLQATKERLNIQLAQSLEDKADANTANPTQQLIDLATAIRIKYEEDRANKRFEVYRNNLFYEELGAEPSAITATLSPDGKKVAFGTRQGENYQLKIYDINPSEKNIQLNFQTTSEVSASLMAIDFSDDSKTVVAGGNDHTVHIWENGRFKYSNKLDEKNIVQVKVNSSGRQAMIGFLGSNDIIFWDVVQHRATDTIYFNEPISCFQYAPNKRTVVGTTEGALYLLNERGKRVQKMATHSSKISAIRYSQNQQWLASGDEQGNVNIYAYQNDTLSVWDNVVLHYAKISDLRFSNDGQLLLVSASDRTATLWRVADKKLLYRLGGEDTPILSAAFSEDQKSIYTVSSKGHVKKWELPSVTPSQYYRVASNSAVNSAQLTKNSNQLEMIAGLYDGNIVKWSPNTPRKAHFFIQHHEGRSITQMAAQQENLITGDEYGKLLIHHIPSAQQRHQLESPHRSEILAIVLNETATMAATADAKTVAIWEVGTGKLIAKMDSEKTIANIQFSAKQQSLMLALSDGNIAEWTWQTAKQQIAFALNSIGLTELYHGETIFSKDGKLLINASADTLTWVNLAAQQHKAFPVGEVTLLTANTSNDLQFPQFAIATSDQKVWLLDEQGNAYHTIFIQGNEGINALSLHENTLVCGFSDGSIQIWRGERRRLE